MTTCNCAECGRPAKRIRRDRPLCEACEVVAFQGSLDFYKWYFKREGAAQAALSDLSAEINRMSEDERNRLEVERLKAEAYWDGMV